MNPTQTAATARRITTQLASWETAPEALNDLANFLNATLDETFHAWAVCTPRSYMIYCSVTDPDRGVIKRWHCAWFDGAGQLVDAHRTEALTPLQYISRMKYWASARGDA